MGRQRGPDGPDSDADSAGSDRTQPQRAEPVPATPHAPAAPDPALFNPDDLFFDTLSDEIRALIGRLAPTRHENALRAWITHCVADLCASVWGQGNFSLSVFGSAATGVYLPESDIDIVVEPAPHAARFGDPLAQLRRVLRSQLFIDPISINHISSARVPVLKFTTIRLLGSIRIDVVANQVSGRNSTSHMVAWFESLPQLSPLTILLKLFLKQRHIDEVFTGGLGGYSLINMIVVVLKRAILGFVSPRAADGSALGTGTRSRVAAAAQQQLPGNASPPLALAAPSAALTGDTGFGLGRLLFEFFMVFGFAFNYASQAICLRDGRLIAPKNSSFATRGAFFDASPDSLQIIDPADPTNNIARGSFRMAAIRQMFQEAYLELDTSRTSFAPGFPAGLDNIVALDEHVQRFRSETKAHWISLQATIRNLEKIQGGAVPPNLALSAWLKPQIPHLFQNIPPMMPSDSHLLSLSRHLSAPTSTAARFQLAQLPMHPAFDFPGVALSSSPDETAPQLLHQPPLRHPSASSTPPPSAAPPRMGSPLLQPMQLAPPQTQSLLHAQLEPLGQPLPPQPKLPPQIHEPAMYRDAAAQAQTEPLARSPTPTSGPDAARSSDRRKRQISNSSDGEGHRSQQQQQQQHQQHQHQPAGHPQPPSRPLQFHLELRSAEQDPAARARSPSRSSDHSATSNSTAIGGSRAKNKIAPASSSAVNGVATSGHGASAASAGNSNASNGSVSTRAAANGAGLRSSSAGRSASSQDPSPSLAPSLTSNAAAAARALKPAASDPQDTKPHHPPPQHLHHQQQQHKKHTKSTSKRNAKRHKKMLEGDAPYLSD
ncbi:Poly(A) polymerase [Polyrhizophydium stewartii]|uniref:polynucleotide adenylyltransferase n=1 Tax=Polyrhizophydium stewartii TaxID=2732419 RepID=A0ABR4N693_9FUNG